MEGLSREVLEIVTHGVGCFQRHSLAFKILFSLIPRSFHETKFKASCSKRRLFFIVLRRVTICVVQLFFHPIGSGLR
jgi:hypothetical protein